MGISTMHPALHPLMAGGGAVQTGTVTAAEIHATDTGWGGFSDASNLSFTFSWRKANGFVALWISSSTTLVSTSNASTFTAPTGALPAAIRPTASRHCFSMGVDNTTVNGLMRVLVSTTGAMTFALGTVSGTAVTFPAAGGWTSSGNKGFQSTFGIIYQI